MIKTDTAELYICNFFSRDPRSPQVPVSEFPANLPFTLEWDSNGTFFQLYQKSSLIPIYEGSATSFQVQGLTTDTTFILEAVSGNNSVYSSYTVTISNPILYPQSAEIITDLRVDGSLSGGQATFNSVGTSFLNVIDTANLSTVNINNTLSLPSTITAQSSMVTGDFGLIGKLSLNGYLDSMNATVFMLGKGVRNTVTETAPTSDLNVAPSDGFLLVTVPPPAYIGSGVTFGPVYDNASVGIWVDGSTCWYISTGAYVRTANGNGTDGGQWMCNPLCIPIKKGTSWMYKVTNDALNKQKIPGLITWISMGASGSIINNASSTKSSEELMIPDFPEQTSAPASVLQNKKNKAAAFLNTLEKVIGKSISAEDKHLLADQLIEL